MASSRDSTSAGAGKGTADGTFDQGWDGSVVYDDRSGAWAKGKSPVKLLVCAAQLLLCSSFVRETATAQASCRTHRWPGMWPAAAHMRKAPCVWYKSCTVLSVLHYSGTWRPPPNQDRHESCTQRSSHSPTCRGLTFALPLSLCAYWRGVVERESDAPASTLAPPKLAYVSASFVIPL